VDPDDDPAVTSPQPEVSLADNTRSVGPFPLTKHVLELLAALIAVVGGIVAVIAWFCYK
jgi:hypothetical protein